MPVNLPEPLAVNLHPVPGVRIGVTEAGVRKANRKDLTVFLLDEGALESLRRIGFAPHRFRCAVSIWQLATQCVLWSSIRVMPMLVPG